MVDFDYIGENISRREYSLIGSGTGRLVFDLGDGYVVKVARNKKGVVQNRSEYQIAGQTKSDLFAKIIAISENHHLLIMEKAERIKSITVVWDYYKVNSNRELFQLELFKDFPSKYSLLLGDLCRKSSWGLIHDRPVIIDYGFTKETRRYYAIF